MDLLCEVNVRGTTVVVATHDTQLLSRYPKRTIKLERGQLVSDRDRFDPKLWMAAG
jgi:cell division transport system ATP-binding protein